MLSKNILHEFSWETIIEASKTPINIAVHIWSKQTHTHTYTHNIKLCESLVKGLVLQALSF